MSGQKDLSDIQLVSALICIIICLTIAVVELTNQLNKRPQATKQPEPCKCLTYEQLAAYTAFYEVYVDSSQNGRKSDRKRFSDSVAKYKNLLKIK